MFYVVSEDFLNSHGSENSVHASYRWRSRREVVNWLTSMLSKQHWHDGNHSRSPKGDPMSGVGAQKIHIPDYKDRLSRNLKGHASDIVWSGVAWACGKQLKHYPAFCRNGITIAIQSFVFVMAEEENCYLVYLEDMYEDRNGQKKVKVRWFHHNREVKGVVSLRNPDPKEVHHTLCTSFRRQIRVQYDDVKDEDGSGNLEEWIPAFRLAMPDKFGMRHKGRPTIRPALSHNKSLLALEGGAPVDAWRSDGWWEGVLIGIGNSEDGILQVYVPSENVFLNVHGTNLRASKDWVGSRWVDIETNATIISAISAAISRDTKLSTISNIDKEAKSDDFPISSHEALTNAAMPT